jgi:hypothetical protein
MHPAHAKCRSRTQDQRYCARVVRTHEPVEPADGKCIELLVQRDGERTIVCLGDGRRLSVLNVAWGYDEGDTYARVTTNISPDVEGEAVDVFLTSEIDTIQDDAGAVLHRVV